MEARPEGIARCSHRCPRAAAKLDRNGLRCGAPAAGGHYDPTGAPHAGRDAKARHVGDLGNVTADSAGVVDTTFVDSVIALGGPHSIVGRGVIVHAGADDLKSQPSGAAGARVACGVVGVDGPES